jgi:ABC-type transporter Mla MlaB component
MAIMLKVDLTDPLAANLNQLWSELEGLVQALPEHQRLQVAGEAITQLAELVCLRAEALLSDLDRTETELLIEGCSLSRDALEPFLRHTVTLNLDQVLLEPSPRTRSQAIQSIAGELDKSVLLAVLDGEQQKEKEQALAVSHSEAVEVWIGRLQQCLDSGCPVRLSTLWDKTDLARVEVWMALLLGGFKLEQQGEFYDSDAIVVSRPV